MSKLERQRRIVLEQVEFSGNPLAPADLEFPIEPVLLGGDERSDTAIAQRVHFPSIGARLVIPLPDRAPIVRQEPLYSVHYNLLALCSLSDYRDPLVRYTAWGLIRDMGWNYGGRQTSLLRRCVDYLKEMKLEIEGNLPDPGIPRRSAERIYEMRILIGGSYPTKEERRSGGRNMSHVEYHPRYLRALRQMKAVQIDVAVMSQIRGGLARSFYRTASYLRHTGRDRIDLHELFARVGSNRERVVPAIAHRVFGPAYEVMHRYRYIREIPPRCEPNGSGGFTMIFDWGEPIQLPSGGDQLFRAYTDVGVDARVAAEMIAEDERRAVAVMQAFQQGALPTPKDTVARLLVGCFRDPSWELSGVSDPDPQTTLPLQVVRAPAPRSRGAAPARPAAETPGRVPAGIDWEAVRATPGGWSDFWMRVLTPLLAAAGDTPSRVAGLGPVMERLERAFGRIGWEMATEVARGVSPYLADAARPASYLATVLEKEAPDLPPPSKVNGAGGGARPTSAAPTAPPRGSRSGAPSRVAIDSSRFLVHMLETWLEQLREHPNRLDAKRALDFLQTHGAKIRGTDQAPLVDQVATLARAFLEPQESGRS
jgi:hypothetical protein